MTKLAMEITTLKKPLLTLQIDDNTKKVLSYEVNGKPKQVIYWLAKLINPESPVKLSDEHQDFKWLPLQQSQELCGYDNMKVLLSEFYNQASSQLKH